MSTEIEFLPDPSGVVNRREDPCESLTSGSGSLTFPQYAAPNFAGLRALTVHNQDQIVSVLGLVTPTDGQGGGYRFESTSMAVDDGATVGKPDNVLVGNPGRWLKYT